MHRSGTSLLANWLYRCGLNLGDSFVKTDVGNVKGYFEDELLVSFQRRMTKDLSLESDYLIWEEQISPMEKHLKEAKSIVAKRNNNLNQWSWKDPRTCLFMDLWQVVIPNLYCVAVFRHFDEVVDSLVRRKIKAEKIRRNKLAGFYNQITKSKYKKREYIDKYLKSWIRHNKEILKFLNSSSKRNSVLIESKFVAKNSKELFYLIKRDFGFEIENVDFKNVFESGLMKDERDTYDYSKDLRVEAENLYKKLVDFSNKGAIYSQSWMN